MPDSVSAQRSNSDAVAKEEESVSATGGRLGPAVWAARRAHHGRAGRTPRTRPRDETPQVRGGLRRREEVTLRLIASVLDEREQLLLGLDALGGHLQVEC